MAAEESREKLCKYIEDNKSQFISNLKEAVEIPSVSCWAASRPSCFQMVSWTDSKLKELGFTTEIRQQENHEVEGKILQLPPILTGFLGSDPSKKTVLIYGHLDVQPAKTSDGWDYEPFTLTEAPNGNLYGRGSTDDKGPVLGWLHAVEAFQKVGVEIPVNIKIVFECMEEVGSEGLEEMLISLKDTFLKDVDVVTISDNYWIGTQTPCLTYGLRGLSYFSVEVECGTKDLHSGVFGGAVHEALPDLIWLLDQLVDVKGTIQIPGVMDDVLKLTEERADSTTTLISIPKPSKTRLEFGACPLLHGIEGAFSDPGAKTVIPRKVIGKFSIRLVANQEPDKIGKIVKSYLETKWEQRGSPNKMVVSMGHGGRPFISDYNHPNYVAAVKATEFVYGVKPIMTRSGGSIPITIVFQEVTGKNVMLLPMGQADDGAHSQNEKISKRNYIEGTKLFVTYLLELGALLK
ncbi:Cytosolic non-specific dipeptidase [Orchesella cincta]|uniref:Cytosolic non-specific dipeptidase n=1 Tax=Orchesella cincta TaxID=48709 RepID=A0A1D2MEW8_ORCCI|nr:Cytosolic non-specific dipeptidase [Orchesella cincta]